MSEARRGIGRRIAPYLALLAGAFLFRVLAQLVQLFHPLPFLPAFSDWHGGVLPYPGLLLSQALILVAMGLLIRRVRLGRLTANPKRQWLCWGFGTIYAGVMAFRLLAGLTFWSDKAWFAAYLPASFHLVLAAFVLLFGLYFHMARRRPRTSGQK